MRDQQFPDWVKAQLKTFWDSTAEQQSKRVSIVVGVVVMAVVGVGIIRLKIAYPHQSLLDDAPVGILLSGGLDSAIVAALLVQAGVSVRAYSLDFGDVDDCELPYAEQVAQHLHIPLVKVDASPRRVRSALIPTVQALDLSFGDGVSTCYVKRPVKQFP